MALPSYQSPFAIKAQPFNQNPLGAPPTGLFGMGAPGRMYAGGPGGLVQPAVTQPSPSLTPINQITGQPTANWNFGPTPLNPSGAYTPPRGILAPPVGPAPTPQAAVTNALMGQRRTIQPVARGVSAY